MKPVSLVKIKLPAQRVKETGSTTRGKDQDFLDQIDLKSDKDFGIYKQRQMIVEHPFGTIKHIWSAGYYLTRDIDSVLTETALSCLAYNLKRAINILGVEEMVERLKERKNRRRYSGRFFWLRHDLKKRGFGRDCLLI